MEARQGKAGAHLAVRPLQGALAWHAAWHAGASGSVLCSVGSGARGVRVGGLAGRLDRLLLCCVVGWQRVGGMCTAQAAPASSAHQTSKTTWHTLAWPGPRRHVSMNVAGYLQHATAEWAGTSGQWFHHCALRAL